MSLKKVKVAPKVDWDEDVTLFLGEVRMGKHKNLHTLEGAEFYKALNEYGEISPEFYIALTKYGGIAPELMEWDWSEYE